MESKEGLGVAGDTEGARRATGVSPADAPAGAPDLGVEAKPTRRRFTTEYKLRLLRYGARRRHVQSRPVPVQEERDNFIWLIVNDEKEISTELNRVK